MERRRNDRSTFIRIWRICLTIKDGNFPNARSLAEKMEVSVRTIERDIEQLRDQMQAPIVFDRTHKGYVFTGEFSLPSFRFTEGEILSLFLGQKLLAKFEGMRYPASVNTLREKLECLLSDESKCSSDELEDIISFDIQPLRGEDIQVASFVTKFQKAIIDHQQVIINYQSLSSGESRERIIYPYHLRLREGVWYVIGHCTVRKEVRIFAVDRISSLTVLDSQFIYPTDFDINRYLDGVWGIIRGQLFGVAIRFDHFQARWIRERPLRKGESLEEQDDGGLIFRCRVSGLTEIKQWVMSFGSHAVVLEPEELKVEVAEEVKKLAAIYQTDSK